MKRQHSNIKALYYLLTIACIGFVSSCSVKEYIPEGELFYTGVKHIEYTDKDKRPNARFAVKDLESVLLYRPNNSFVRSASIRLPFTYPFYFNKYFANSNNFFGRWLYKNFGTTPILISEVNPPLRSTVGAQILSEYGYFDAHITPEVHIHSRDSVQAHVRYYVTLGEPHLLDSIEYHIPLNSPSLPELLSPENRLLQKGDPFGILNLENERERISDHLRSEGYYYFSPNYITYKADTTMVPKKVQLRVQLSESTLPEAYEPWHIGDITYDVRDVGNHELTDSLFHEGIKYRFYQKSPIRIPALQSRVRIKPGYRYNLQNERRTVSSMAVLNTFSYTDVNYTPRRTDSLNYLDVLITSREDLPYFTELEATYRFKSNNQTGPGLTFAVNKKNLFGGGELLTVQLQAGYEWETRRSRDRQNSWDLNSYNLGAVTSLTLPKLLLPVLTGRPTSYPATTKIQLSVNVHNRARFYQQAQFAGELSYRLEPRLGIRHAITPLSISYNKIMRQTEGFVEAIESTPALGLSFRNQFIPQANYLFGYETTDPLSRSDFSLEVYIAEAGNLLSLAYSGKKREGNEPHKFIGSPFAQFIKGFLELRYNFRPNDRFQVASRLFSGAIYSYGNMLVPPYSEQFYVGGANSVRGFNVRSIGPGAYHPMVSDPMDFLDRNGDLRLEANLEFRYRLLGALELATFIDAGNVWLLRADSHRPNGLFKKEHFFNDLALGTGLGVRYDLNFLVIRFDVGLGLHMPSRTGEKYFNTFRNGWPVAFHLAVGYPF